MASRGSTRSSAMLYLFLLFASFSSQVACGIHGDRSKEDIKATVDSLFEKVTSLQVKKDTDFSPPLNWAKRRGMYESDVKFYFHGNEEFFLLREAFKVYDDNMFSTTWITSCLLETFRYGKGPKPTEDQIMAAILAVREYHDKNVDYANSLMTFWPQQYNETYKAWVSFPANLHHFFDLALNTNITGLEKVLDALGLQDIAETLARLQRTTHGYLHAFLIPPDFDDTFVNLGLGSLLAEMKNDFPESYAQWKAQNTNVTSVFHAMKKYAYRPMSNDSAVNTIDCRTYFYLRYFLEKAANDGQDIALVPTWAQDTEEVKTWGPRGVDMPFNINNIDVTVAANAVFGTTAGILNGLVEPTVLNDPLVQQVYLNTSNLISFMIETNLSSRHDLALLYYPSTIEFYWFVARTFGELQRKANTGPLPHPVLETVRKELDRVLHTSMTWAILNASQSDGGAGIFFDDFLGDGDFDSNNQTKIRGEDRLFTTGMAINALLSTWTVFDEKNGTLKWEANTPSNVKYTVTAAANFLNEHILGLIYQPWNAFFSGSVKGATTWTSYPVNRSDRENVKVEPGKLDRSVYIRGMQGVVSEAEYKELLKKKWDGRQTPIDFHGYNAYPDYWPFWCSESYTYVTSMLALAKFSNTH